MTSIETNCVGIVTIRCRRQRTLFMRFKAQARTNATYNFSVYADDDQVLYTAQSSPVIAVDGIDVVLKDYSLNIPTGCYRYELLRIIPNVELKPIISGTIIIMP